MGEDPNLMVEPIVVDPTNVMDLRGTPTPGARDEMTANQLLCRLWARTEVPLPRMGGSHLR